MGNIIQIEDNVKEEDLVDIPEFLFRYSSTFFKAADKKEIAIKKHFPNFNKKKKSDMYIKTPNAFLEANPKKWLGM